MTLPMVGQKEQTIRNSVKKRPPTFIVGGLIFYLIDYFASLSAIIRFSLFATSQAVWNTSCARFRNKS